MLTPAYVNIDVLLWDCIFAHVSFILTEASLLIDITNSMAHTKDKSAVGQYKHAAVAADVVPCSTVGIDILQKKKGSAVDAAIATMLCAGVVHSHTSGIGGGHFMTIYTVPNDGSGEKVCNTILARERAPLKASRDMFVNSTYSSVKGGMAIAVPGEVKGFYEAWKKFGRVPWADLCQPAINLCVQGFSVTANLAQALQNLEEDVRGEQSLRELFVKKDGTLVQEGDQLYRPQLAKTLQIIAQDPDSFYDPESQLAQDIIADIQDCGGIVSIEDLRTYKVYDKDPLKVKLDNGSFTVMTPRPPSSGVLFQHIMKVLDGYNITEANIKTTEEKILTYHRIVEAFKFGFAKRSQLGDEEFVDGIQKLVDDLISPAYTEDIRAKINDTCTEDVMCYEPVFDGFIDSGTAHASILSEDGSAVSVTASNNYYLGSRRIGKRTGILFNNEMDDFSTPGTINEYGIPSSPANYIEPYKMPMSSMCPAIITDDKGDVTFVTGASGGSRITPVLSFVSSHYLWMGVPLNEAIDLKRLHHQLIPDLIMYEPGFDEKIIDGLKKKMHKIEQKFFTGTEVETIHKIKTDQNNTYILAVCDFRKGGLPDGF